METVIPVKDNEILARKNTTGKYSRLVLSSASWWRDPFLLSYSETFSASAHQATTQGVRAGAATQGHLKK